MNNVGESIIKELFDTSLEEWNTIMTLNITSMFLLCREVGRHMREARAGKIINISSVLGMRSAGSTRPPARPASSPATPLPRQR